MPETGRSAIWPDSGHHDHSSRHPADPSDLCRSDACIRADCPVAVVANATQPSELVLRGTLTTIADQVEDAGLRQAAVIMVGRRCTPRTLWSLTCTASVVVKGP